MKLWGSSDIGVVRQENQDTYMLHELEDGALLVVCDGMGGAKGGSTASSTASHAFAEAVEQGYQKNMKPSEMADLVALAATKANAAVYQAARQDPSLSGMGTTVTLLWEDGKRVLVGHVGDSRAYRLRGGELKQITQDHSIVAELLRNNVITAEMARNHPYRNVITRAVGVDPVVTPDVIDEDKQPDDVWLVCSDGLYNMVSDDVIRDTGSETDEQAADSLLSLALENGGSDNITFVICRVTEVDGQ